VAERLGVPAVVVQIYPIFVPTRAFPNPIYHYRWLRNLPGELNRATYPAFRLMLRSFAGRAVDIWRERSLRLPRRPGRHNPLRWPDGRPAPVLNPVSPHVVPPPPDYPAHVHTTGYWALPARPGWTPPPSLTEFLAAGEPPVYVGFGSVVGDARRAGQVVAQALRVAGVRAVLATGRGGLEMPDLPPGVLVIDQAPHDWLLPRMAATVHHGGGGTTFAAICAGRPQVVCPFVIDQIFWGERMHALGVSPAPIPQGRLTVERLAGAIRTATTDAGLARRARELGSLVSAENGTADAVAIIERILAGADPMAVL
jgi:sterol 3beta-glucosyltransferase